MIRKIIKIDPEKCNGCGACAAACHEGAIEMIEGKAKLTRENYCDGLGDCLPACPTDAISFELREAPAYDEAAVLAAKRKAGVCTCPGSREGVLLPHTSDAVDTKAPISSRLYHWPVQLKLAPLQGDLFANADLLIAADCSAYAYGDFHRDFMQDRVTLIGCPKLDGVDYAQKLGAIFASNTIHSITVVRMEVPCCGGLENAVKRALAACGKDIPLQIVTLSTNGKIRSVQ